MYESSSTGPLAAGMGTLTGAAKTGSARAKREAKAAKDFMTTRGLDRGSYDEIVLRSDEQGGPIYSARCMRVPQRCTESPLSPGQPNLMGRKRASMCRTGIEGGVIWGS